MDRRWLWPVTLLLAAAMACQLLPTGVDSKSASDVATQVAGTLTALAPSDDVQTAASPTAANLPTATALPLVAPGELEVVYTDGGHPWLWTQNGGSQQLSQTSDVIDVLLSDDGQRVVFIRHEPSDHVYPVEVRAINSDGSSEIVLLSADDFDAIHPLQDFPHNDLSEIAFVPGSHMLILNTRALPEGPGLLKYNDLLLLDADSGELTPVLPAEQGGDFVVSPDGTKVGVIRPDSISVAQIDGTIIRDEAITFEPIITYSEFQYSVKPVWEADSSSMLVAVPSHDPLADETGGTVWRIPADGGEPTDMGTISGSFYFPQLSGGSLISPQLDKVVYLRETDGARELYVANFDTMEEVLYASGDLDWRGWSSDGMHFVYLLGNNDQLQVGAPGADPQALITGTDLTWTGADNFLVLQGSMGDWSLTRGWVEVAEPSVISQPQGDFVQFDWARPQ
ncbi:MAG: hypothetical protein WBR18_14880 [Anaerolineales bacterium]